MRYDVAVIGGGAAGLMAAIFAARERRSVLLLERKPKIGAKILISGGGRCNVTHDVVHPEDFNGGSRNSIAKVLRTFDVPATIRFFEDLGVPLKREEGGKLFPVSDRARSVVDALLGEAERCGVRVDTGRNVTAIRRSDETFLVGVDGDVIEASRVIVSTGGRSVPKTGSDGSGYGLVRAFGHTVTETFPALVPLVAADGAWITSLSGTSTDCELIVRARSGKVLRRDRGSLLFTHFGLSGPVALDVSRHLIAARTDDPAAILVANFLPGETLQSLDEAVLEESKRNARATIGSTFRHALPERLVEAVAREAGAAAQKSLVSLAKEERRRLVRMLVECELPVARDRGFDYAEVTAGGVPLTEVNLATLESREQHGLYLCGEILDVDGRIGGYNFQWAWASGRLAGMSAAKG